MLPQSSQLLFLHNEELRYAIYSVYHYKVQINASNTCAPCILMHDRFRLAFKILQCSNASLSYPEQCGGVINVTRVLTKLKSRQMQAKYPCTIYGHRKALKESRMTFGQAARLIEHQALACMRLTQSCLCSRRIVRMMSSPILYRVKASGPLYLTVPFPSDLEIATAFSALILPAI